MYYETPARLCKLACISMAIGAISSLQSMFKSIDWMIENLIVNILRKGVKTTAVVIT